ncbi:hypothetical protein [Streptomyces caeruleatus]|uniref:Uncharacterized protein n=1 Tax=Streptomyces caeruleatus TaxID=661399 RepID=A0A124IAM9_9ACTN|nr:hypothetical protein [Streptomyces caeruleatus]KUO06201.1 hypothetical protein AQJ67_01660 [Streptomyces caeruleatus]
MTAIHSRFSRAIRVGACAVLLGGALITVNGGPAYAQAAEIPGQLLGGWIAEDKSSHVEFEADGTYLYVQVGQQDYSEAGNFEVRQQEIQYAPDSATSQDQETAPPGPYSETWNITTRNDGTDQLVTQGSNDSWTFLEMDLSQCSSS